MSEQMKDGGPAFPVPNDANVNGQEGMYLRDYFAAKVMPESLREFHVFVNDGGQVPDNWRVGIALEAYAMADAMLIARS